MIRKRTGVLTLMNSDELPLWRPIDEFFDMVAEPSKATVHQIGQHQAHKAHQLLLSVFPAEEHKHLHGSFSQSYHNAFAFTVGHHRDLPHPNFDLEICFFMEVIVVGDRITWADKAQFTHIPAMIEKEKAAKKVLDAKMFWHQQFGGKLKQSKDFTEKVVVDKFEKLH